MSLIICEAGQNHNGDMKIATKLIWEAYDKGADLVKFQLYDSKKLYGEYQPTELTKEQAARLFQYGKDIGIEVFFSVFDVERVDWCEEMGVKRYKVAASQIENAELATKIIFTGKKVIISLPFGADSSLAPSSQHFRYSNIKYLYCVPKYPAPFSDLHLADIFSIRWDEWNGYSDHTIGLDAVKIALARGAQIIEKHFTLNKTMPGPDHIHSMTPPELQELVRFSKIVEEVL